LDPGVDDQVVDNSLTQGRWENTVACRQHKDTREEEESGPVPCECTNVRCNIVFCTAKMGT